MYFLKTIGSLTAFLFFILLINCDKTPTEPQNITDGSTTSEIAYIQFIHAASSTSELDLAYKDLADGSFYAMESGTEYGHQYGYYNLYGGEREINLYLSFSNISVASVITDMEAENKYTLIAHDLDATLNPELIFLSDTLTAPETGKVFVRFVHAGADAGPLNLSETGGSTVIASLDWTGYSGYQVMDAGTYRFTVTTQPSQNIVNLNPVTLLSGQIYCAVLSGSIAGTTPVDLNIEAYRETSL